MRLERRSWIGESSEVREMVRVEYLSIRHQQKATLANFRKGTPRKGIGWLLALSGGQRTESEPRAVGTAWLGHSYWHLALPVPPSLLPSDSLIVFICYITCSRIKVMGRSGQLARLG